MVVFISLAEPKELVDLANRCSYSQGRVKGRRAIIRGLLVFVPAVVLFLAGAEGIYSSFSSLHLSVTQRN